MLKFESVGCGRIAKLHSELLGDKQIAGASLVAVCDIDIAKAKKIGEQFNVPYFSDMHEMMSEIEKVATLIPRVACSSRAEISHWPVVR